MTKPKCNLFQKVLTILFLCIACISTSTAQEATLVTSLNVSLGSDSPRFKEELIENDGKYYWYATKVNSRINDIFNDIEIEDIDTPSLGGADELKASILIEYTPGEGFTDYIVFPYGDKGIRHYSFKGDSLLIWSDYYVFAVNDSIVSGDLDSLLNFYDADIEGSLPTRLNSFAIYDTKLDSIVDTYSFDEQKNFSIEGVALSDNSIYMCSDANWSYELFGDTLDLFIPGDLSSSNSHLSKLNLTSRKLEWTKHIGDTSGSGLYSGAEKTVLDEYGNVIVLFNTWDRAQFDGVYLDDKYGQLDYTLYKVSPEGELIKHLKFNAPNDPQAFRNYRIEKDGSVNVMGVTQGPQPMWVAQDSFYIGSPPVASLAIRVDKDWNFQWHKSYAGSSVVSAMNSTSGTESLVFIPILDSLILSDTVIYHTYEELYPQFVPSAILKFDKEGSRVGEPFMFGDRGLFWEAITLDKDKYLFMVKFKSESGQFEFLGESYGFGISQYVSFIEVEGNLFDIISSLSLATNENDLQIYPSPAIHGSRITVEFPISIVDDNTNLLIYDNNGLLEVAQRISKGQDKIVIQTEHLSKGIKRITLINENHKTTKSILIF